MMSSKTTSSTAKLPSKPTKPSAPPVSRVQTNLNRSAASSNQSLHSSTSETQSQSTVRASSIRRSPSSNEILTENIDDFAIGDKVWVNGQRPGIIKFLGETKFAPGIWSGIELDTDDGKNDGSIGDVRYFKCPPKFGVFVRPQRLTNKQIESAKSSNKSSPVRETPPLTPTSIERHQQLMNNSRNGNNSNGISSRLENKFQVGDRVLVNATSGTKLGTLMFLGEADFAPGIWAGIELDEAMGKNDGSVAGKRYFKCEQKYGLFAPILKISAAPLSALKVVKKSAKQRPSISRQRSGSQESLNSIASSTASSTRPTRVRLGVTSLSSSLKGSKSSSQQLAANITANSSALNDALKEKEEHITQLLKERDLERGEVARAAAQADVLEEKLAALQSEHNKLLQEADEEINELKRLNQEYEEMQIKMNTQLEDEKKKLEDLLFRLEEETIVRSDLESQISVMNGEINKLKNEIKSNSELSLKSSSEQVEVLVDKLKALENQRENDVFALQENLVRKEESVLQMEASMEKRNNELANLQSRILEFEQELDVAKQRNDRQMETIDEMNLRLKNEESIKRQLSDSNIVLKRDLKESEKRLIVLEEKLTEISSGKKEVEVVANRVRDLERELAAKDSIERTLEDSLLETKSRYEKFEGEVNSLAEQLTKMRSICDQEIKRRNEAEERFSQLSEVNRNLESKIGEVMRTSGSNSDLMIKMNAEVVDKQKEFVKREKALKEEMESIRKEKDLRETEIRELRIDNEDKKSLINRFQKKEKEVDKIIQANENELKLTRSDCDEKQELVNDLRQQLNEFKTKLNSLTRDQESSKGDLEFKISQLEKDYTRKDRELNDSLQELRKLRDIKFELEIERDQYKRDSERFEKTVNEKQQLIDNMREDVIQMKEEFNKYKTDLEKQLEASKKSNTYLEEIGSDLERQKTECHEVSKENETLRDDNRHLREKVEELRDDIEVMEKRHSEVLAEFEFECERLQHKVESAEELADERQRRLIELEGQQSIAIDDFRRSAEIEKRQLERKLDELEIRVRESIASATARRYEEIDGTDNYEQQIEFLNSVIVDMQKKNDELKARVQVLEEIGLGEFDPSFHSRVRINGHIRARVFCDICDVFDLHETEDCPQQSSLEQDSRNHSHYHAIRTESRAYCDVCEIFGHSSADCPENETF